MSTRRTSENSLLLLILRSSEHLYLNKLLKIDFHYFCCFSDVLFTKNGGMRGRREALLYDHFVCLYVCRSHFFLKTLYSTAYFTDILVKYKIFFFLNMNFLFIYFFQKSSLLIYKSLVFTFSFYISQNIHFSDVLIKYKIFLVKNLDYLQFLFISAKRYIL